MMEAAGGAVVEPTAPSDHEWAHAGTDHVEMLLVHPLPLLPQPDRRGRKGRQARRHVQECNDAIQGLNWYAGYGYGLPHPCSAPNSLQKLAVARVEKLVRAQPPPSETPSEQAAFLELLRGRSVYATGAETGLSLAAFRSPSQVSMPQDVHGAPRVEDLASDGEHYLGKGLQRMLRPASDADIVQEELLHIRPYVDPALLRSRHKYIALVRRLVATGLFIYLLDGDVKERSGIFFVTKTGKKKFRLVIDARRANKHCVTPPGVSLCSVEGLSKIEVLVPDDFDPSSEAGIKLMRDLEMTLGVADVSDAFHNMRIPWHLSRYFALMPLTAGEAGLVGQTLGGVVLDNKDLVSPAAGSLPMGFSWSLFFCQATTEGKMRSCGSLDDKTLLQDRLPPPVFDVAAAQRDCRTAGKVAYVYVDNLGVLGFFERR